MSTFYRHNSSEMDIIKKDFREVTNWIEHLEFIGKEFRALKATIKQCFVEDDLEFSVGAYLKENKTDISALYNYRYSLEGQLECQDMDCHTYYRDQHRTTREKYQETVHKFHALKTKILGNLCWS